MNYLSHFYFDKEQSDSYFILGIALPDLSKAFNKSWNIHPHKHLEKWQDEPTLVGIQKGWERHLKVDRFFHESTFFQEQTHLLKLDLQQCTFDAQFLRPSILAHIGLELILDSLLLKQKRVDVDAFYTHLQKIEPTQMARFMELNGIENAETCLPRYQWFITQQYLRDYVHTERLAFALSKVAERIWGIPLSEQDRSSLEHCLKNASSRLNTDYMVIFEEISQHLNR